MMTVGSLTGTHCPLSKTKGGVLRGAHMCVHCICLTKKERSLSVLPPATGICHLNGYRTSQALLCLSLKHFLHCDQLLPISSSMLGPSKRISPQINRKSRVDSLQAQASSGCWVVSSVRCKGLPQSISI